MCSLLDIDKRNLSQHATTTVRDPSPDYQERIHASKVPVPQCICYYHWANGAQNGVCLIMKKLPSDGRIWQLKKRKLLNPLYFLIIETWNWKLDLSNFHYWSHYKPHYRTQGCRIRENNITTPFKNPMLDPIKDTLVPLRTKFNANGSVSLHTSVYLNLFHVLMGKNSCNCNGVCRYVWTLNFYLFKLNCDFCWS